MAAQPVSHGRGGMPLPSSPPRNLPHLNSLTSTTGAANISKDDTPYADGGIVREGIEGDQGDGVYSSGRGGAANVGGVATNVKAGPPHDAEVIPETATRIAKQESAHYGRGGEGNVVHVHEKKEGGFLDKIKGIFSGKK
jgi:hypothetical protein